MNGSKHPQVTVCMPMYNAASHLRECIDSILAQTFRDFELLIVDDGSTDESVEIVHSYDDPRIRLLQNHHDYIGTINRLLYEGKGDFIARMDADDVMVPDRLEVQLDYMLRHPEIDILGGMMNFTGRIQETFENSLECYPVTLELMTEGTILAHPTVMMRANRIREKQLHYRPAYVYAEDYDFWVEALRAGLRIENMLYHFIYYRLSDEQVSFKHHKEQKAHAEEILKRVYQTLYGEVFKPIDQNGNFQKTAVSSDFEFQKSPISSGDGCKLTIVMPFLNEGDEVAQTLRSIRQTVGHRVRIILINDASDDGYDYAKDIAPFAVDYVQCKHRRGVAANRDLGVALSTTPYVLLLDAHMRFYDSQWDHRLVDLLDADDRVLLCAQSRFLAKNADGQVVVSKQCPTGFGAHSSFQSGSYWPDVDWNLHESLPGSQIEPIAYVLGAGYAISRRYWNRLHGLQGLQKYGCDEALISTKVWREGGRCLLVKDVEIGHIYRSTSPYRHHQAVEVSNYLLTSDLTFSQPWRCLASAVALRKDAKLYAQARRILEVNAVHIKQQKNYLDGIFSVSFEQVLEQHRRLWLQSHHSGDADGKIREVNRFLLERPASHVGLYDGKAGCLIWLCHFSRWAATGQHDALIQQWWDECAAAVKARMLSCNFAQGLSGVGWTFLYLCKHGFVDDYPMSLLKLIDRQLECTHISKMPVDKIDYGSGGLMAYATLRMLTGRPCWSSEFDRDLTQAARVIVENGRCDLPSTYYAMLWLDIQKNGPTGEPYTPRVSEWMTCPPTLSINPKFWKTGLANGCMGALLSRMNTDQHDNLQTQ